MRVASTPSSRGADSARGSDPKVMRNVEVMDVPKIDAQVELDAELLTTVDAVAGRLGVARDEVIEDSIRRGLAARVLGDVLTRVRERSDLSEQQAVQAAYDEVKATRAARRTASSPTGPDDPAR